MTAGRRGSALIEYLGAVVVVGMVLLGLMALRPHQPSRTPPGKASPSPRPRSRS